MPNSLNDLNGPLFEENLLCLLNPHRWVLPSHVVLFVRVVPWIPMSKFVNHIVFSWQHTGIIYTLYIHIDICKYNQIHYISLYIIYITILYIYISLYIIYTSECRSFPGISPHWPFIDSHLLSLAAPPYWLPQNPYVCWFDKSRHVPT